MTDATGTGHSARQRGGALVAGLLAVPLLAVAAPSALAAPADLYAVRQVAGAFVLLESGWASQYGAPTSST